MKYPKKKLFANLGIWLGVFLAALGFWFFLFNYLSCDLYYRETNRNARYLPFQGCYIEVRGEWVLEEQLWGNLNESN